MIDYSKEFLSAGGLEHRLRMLFAPPIYLAQSTRDFNEEKEKISFPRYKAFLNRLNLREGEFFEEMAYISIRNIGVSVREVSDVFAKVRLHDKEGEIHAYWSDADTYIARLREFSLEMKEQLMVLDKAEPEDKGRIMFPDIASVPMDKRLGIYHSLIGFFRYHHVEGNQVFPPDRTIGEVRDIEGLRDEDWAYEALFAYFLRKKTAYIIDVTKKYSNSLTRRLQFPARKEGFGALLPTPASS